MPAHQQNGNMIAITNCPPTLKKELTNIADNLGVSLTSLLKVKLREIRDSYPEKMRLPKQKD